MPGFTPPLAVYFVWHPADEPTVKSLAYYSASQLQKDVKRPFSRAVNVPVFYRTTTQKGIPIPIPVCSEKVIIFVFVGKEVVADAEWTAYVEQLPVNDQCRVIPIALDLFGLKLRGNLNGINCIRSYDFPKLFIRDYVFISVAHEIYKYNLNDTFNLLGSGQSNSLKLFLSHAKDGKFGIKLANGLKTFIDNSTMRNFFDATDIAPGYRFNEEIIENIKDATVIAIHSDPYSSRYWCQREILSAKELDRPMIAVDCLEEFEDRRFPFASNIPGVHVHPQAKVSEKDLVRILSTALLETIRFFYSKLLLAQYKAAGWIPPDAVIMSRPPEVADIEKILVLDCGVITRRYGSVVYPEPPVYSEEVGFLGKLGIRVFTPITFDAGQLQDKRVGISISEPAEEELVAIGQSNHHLQQLAQEFARHLLARGSTLMYGGDLRADGFTQFMFDEAQAVQAKLSVEDCRVENYIAWPIYVNDDIDLKAWKASYRSIASMFELPFPKDVDDLVPSKDVYLPPFNVPGRFVWSRSLTEMRKEMIGKCHARICAGGRTSGYLGIMPGILEETLTSLELGKPTFILGGFGGISSCICRYIETGVAPDELTLDWQVDHNANFKEFIEFCGNRGQHFFSNYKDLISLIVSSPLNNGLSEEDNRKLFATSFVDEAIYLVFKGLKNINLPLIK